MLPVFLTSNGLYDDAVFTQFNKILQEHNIEKKICLITTAIKDSESRSFHINKTTVQLTDVGFSTVDFIDIANENPRILYNYPIVCIFGGNPFYLLEQIKKAKVDDILIDIRESGSMILGHSSGAVVLGKTIKHANILHPEWNEIGITDFDAVGLIPEIILPHHNRYLGQEQKLVDLEIKENLKLTRIEDGHYIVI
ncbi:Type 1 glutamine amidotransferase-like domain-containing protein [Paenibacillus sp. V4I7]|uniref:Type 1 glutamine amidotransferase-like domain-containing protein n=1 Tax=Paenibacillus sp. V4I7 TaxID=3042307 RepID=UPI00278201D0|nr:Type 1 glutamine amidotransferase-like domain-containing protein [Paenibacillus sp. V4I7]MDQ0897474.1 peptidase E [Paenibacillus sp. V4I7]